MEETLRLIRLLVEAPAEEPLLDRPAELIDRLQLDDRARTPVVEQPSTPKAEPKRTSVEAGPAASTKDLPPFAGPFAKPKGTYTDFGATADPKTSRPNVGYDAQVHVLDAAPGPPAQARSAFVEAGKAATPTLAEVIAGRQATARPGETIVAKVQATPKTTVTMIAPQALPFDVAEAFRDADQTEVPESFPHGSKQIDWGIPPFDPMQTTPEFATQVFSTYLPDDVRYTL